MTIGRQPITNKQLIERPYNFRAKLQGRKGVGYIVPFVGGNRSLEADLRAPLPCKLTFVSLSLDAT
jgi:hypothetical protein